MKRIKAIVAIVMLLAAAGFGLFAEDEKVSAKPYGFVKLDAIYETGSASHGNYILWAKDPGASDGMFYVSARETRLGFLLTGIGFGKFKVTGKVEVDFHAAGVPENKPYNFMRHAFLEVSNGSFSIIAGQTSDIISPLVPVTLNYTVLWGGGNIGYRRPQLGFKRDFKAGKNSFTVHAGITRTITDDYDGDGIEDGLAAGFPTIQGRLSGKFAVGSSANLQLGISGHYGKTNGVKDYTTNSIDADFLLTVSKFKIIAEYFMGKNLGAFLGGIVQDINPVDKKEVETRGFFINGVAEVSSKMQISLGYGMDDPDDATLAVGLRSKNTCVFGNFVIKLSPSLKLGLEISNWVTDYLNKEQQKTLRFQHSWIFTF